jgi:hypothetical protein
MPDKIKFIQCDRCKGEGALWEKIQNRGTLDYVLSYVVCQQPGCHNGMVNLEECYKQF